MKVRIHSSELNRMMKSIIPCVDVRDPNRDAVIVTCNENGLSIRGVGGQYAAVATAKLLAGEEETFCVTGSMFAKVCAMCSGEVEISTDDRNCTVKGAGRTRLPKIKANIPEYEHASGTETTVKAEDFARCYNGVSYAVSADQGRIVLTGVLVEAEGDRLKMTGLDGFQMAIESIPCRTDGLHAIVPNGFMKLVKDSTSAGEEIVIRCDGKRIEAMTDGLMISCGLLSGEYPNIDRILPQDFATRTLTHADQLRDALKSGSVINSDNNLVKLDVGSNSIRIMSNSERADYEATVDCETQGSELTIAFNQRYLMNAVNVVGGDQVILQFNAPTTPCVLRKADDDGVHLVLPVRVHQ